MNPLPQPPVTAPDIVCQNLLTDTILHADLETSTAIIEQRAEIHGYNTPYTGIMKRVLLHQGNAILWSFIWNESSIIDEHQGPQRGGNEAWYSVKT